MDARKRETTRAGLGLFGFVLFFVLGCLRISEAALILRILKSREGRRACLPSSSVSEEPFYIKSQTNFPHLPRVLLTSFSHRSIWIGYSSLSRGGRTVFASKTKNGILFSPQICVCFPCSPRLFIFPSQSGIFFSILLCSSLLFFYSFFFFFAYFQDAV